MIFKMIRERRFKRQVAEMRAEKDAACARGEHVAWRKRLDEYFGSEW